MQLMNDPWLQREPSCVHQLGLPDITLPMQYGDGVICIPSSKLESWSHEKIVLRALKQLVLDNVVEKKAFIFSEHVLASTSLTSAYLEWMIEECNVDFVSVVASPVASLSGLGLTTGLTMDIGETQTRVCAVLEGAVAAGSALTSSHSGRSVTETLLSLLQSRKSYYIPPHLAYFLGTSIKESHAFVASDYVSLQKLHECTFSLLQPTGIILPDGNTMCLESERYECCENLVSTELALARHESSLPNTIVDSLLTLDVDTRAALIKDLWFVGGGCILKGLEARFNRELKLVYYQRLQSTAVADGNAWLKDIRIKRPYSPEDTIFSGTMILGEMSVDSADSEHRRLGDVTNMWRSKGECNEEGYARIVQALRMNR
eukprot:Gregarina_sp_Poly_1__10776@NODE_827_length_6114_cov_65_312882_g181_i1_p3_GENE_NODE_827_length_6114_cov_65_312882_g181_i1NODE_827_length_6114_cov_65_312882_g181_i1_p3_ORF_typecomplete_len374_score29_86Actin/PF00022_19/1_5e35MreB_Mbl/PF06723_13/0_00057PilM_2/PF11104_8/70PilM_2/PF11104_8/2_7_NODE_827_length_6114_cov_65_312882_g181_i11431264